MYKFGFLLVAILLAGCLKKTEEQQKIEFAKHFARGCEDGYIEDKFPKEAAHELCKCVADDLIKKNDFKTLDNIGINAVKGAVSKEQEEMVAVSTYICIDIVEKKLKAP